MKSISVIEFINNTNKILEEYKNEKLILLILKKEFEEIKKYSEEEKEKLLKKVIENKEKIECINFILDYLIEYELGNLEFLKEIEKDIRINLGLYSNKGSFINGISKFEKMYKKSHRVAKTALKNTKNTNKTLDESNVKFQISLICNVLKELAKIYRYSTGVSRLNSNIYDLLNDEEKKYVEIKKGHESLLYGLGVCDVFSYAISMIFDILNIRHLVVDGHFKELDNLHVWNMVLIENTWYHIDFTWGRYDILKGKIPKYIFMTEEDMDKERVTRSYFNYHYIKTRKEDEFVKETITKEDVYKILRKEFLNKKLKYSKKNIREKKKRDKELRKINNIAYKKYKNEFTNLEIEKVVNQYEKNRYKYNKYNNMIIYFDYEKVNKLINNDKTYINNLIKSFKILNEGLNKNINKVSKIELPFGPNYTKSSYKFLEKLFEILTENNLEKTLIFNKIVILDFKKQWFNNIEEYYNILNNEYEKGKKRRLYSIINKYNQNLI